MGKGTAASLSEGFNRVGDAAVSLGIGMAASGAVIVGGMVAAGKAAADFQSQLVLLQTHAGASEADMRELGANILQVAGQLGWDPTSLAHAVYHVQSSLTSLAPELQNVTTDEHVMYAAAQLAAIGHASLEDSVNAVTKAFVVYSKDGYDAQRITAIFNKTVGEGNMRLQELNSAFATGLLPVAEQAGVKLESVGAALATMTDQGIPATRAATYLRSALIQLTIPSNAAVDALKAVGVSANDSQSQVDAFSQVLVKAGINQTDVAKKLQQTGSLGDTLLWLREKIQATGLSSQDTAALLEKSFGGIRSGTGVVSLYNNLNGLIQKEKDATKATDEWTHTWATFTGQDPDFQVKQLKASWDALVIVLGFSVLPVLLKFVATVTPLIQQLGLWVAKNSDLVASSIEGAAAFLLIGGAILFVAGVASKIIGFLIPIIMFFWDLGTAAVAAFTAVGGGAGAAGAVIAGAFTGPVAIAIVAIAALIAIGLLLITHWNQVKAVASMVWGWIAPYVAAAIGFLRGIIQAEMAIIMSIWKEHHAQIMAIAQVVWGALKIWILGSLLIVAIAIGIVIIAIVALIAIFLAVGVAVAWVVSKLIDLAQAVAKWLVGAWKDASAAVGAAIAWIIGFVGNLASAIGQFTSNAWNAISRFFVNLVTGAANAFMEFARHPAYWTGFVIGLFIGFITLLHQLLVNFFSWLIDITASQWSMFASTIGTIISAIPGVVGAVMSWIGTIVHNAWNAIVANTNFQWTMLVNSVQAIISALPGIVGGIFSWLGNVVHGIMDWMTWRSIDDSGRLVNGVISRLGEIGPRAWSIGQSIVHGLVDGIMSLAGWAWGMASGFVKGLVDGMKAGIISGSPSLLAAREVGVPLSQGIMLGFQNEHANTLLGMQSLMSRTPSQITPTVNSQVNLNQRQNQVIQLNIDNEVLARTIIRNISQWKETTEHV